VVKFWFMREKIVTLLIAYRLSLCLLVSLGVHVAALYSDRLLPPTESRPGRSPVRVALVAEPVAPVPAPVTDTAASPVAKPAPKPPPPPPVEPKEPPAKPSPEPRPAQKTARLAPPRAQLKPPAVVDPLPKKTAPKPPEIRPQSAPEPVVVRQIVAPVTAPVASRPAAERPVEDLGAPPAAGEEKIEEARPDYLRNPLPEYPYLARQRHWEGVVWLLVDVSASGDVDALRIEKSCGHRVLDRAAKRSVRHWQFHPARRAGLPVASQVRIPVRFSLEDS
jgi:protein TonB